MDSRVVGAIVAVILLALGIVYTMDGFGEAKAGQLSVAAATDEQQLVARVQQDYTTAPDFTGLSNTSANAAQETPKDMDQGGAVIKNQFGGAVTLAPDAGNTAEADITEGGVPVSACLTMANAIANGVSVSINGTALAGSPGQYTAGTVGPACNQAANSVMTVVGK